MKKALSLILSLAVLVTQFVFVIPALAEASEPDLVATFDTKAYCNGSKGYTLEAVAVSDNESFTSAVKTTVTDLDVYESSGMAPAIYNTSNSEDIVDWLSNDDAHLRFWIKIPFDLTVTIRLQHSTGYPSITTSESFEGSENWQEIRIKRSDFSTNATFDSTSANGGTINFQFLTQAGAIEENASFSVSPLEFYNGALPESTPDDGTSSEDSTQGSTLIAKYTEMSYFSESSKGYKLSNVAVADNNFTSAVDFTVSNGELFNSATSRDPAIYKADNADLSIEEWATNPDAEMRFFIKITKNASFRVRLMHYNTAYNNIYKDITFTANDDWQEIVLKRSDFSENSSFDTAISGQGSVNFQFIINQNTFSQGDSVLVSPIEFYSGGVVEDNNSDDTSSDDSSSDDSSSDDTSSDDTSSDSSSSGDTDNGETVLLTKYTEMSYNSGTKGYTIAGNAVADNKNFTNAIKFTVSDEAVFNSLTSRDPAIYKADNATQNIKDWATDPQAEMRFWIKVSKDVNLRIRLVHYLTAYNNIYKDITFTASDKWQEIRIKRSEFSENSAFDSAVAGEGSVNFQFIIEQDALAQDDSVIVSPIEFYSGAIETAIDPEGGTIDLTPKEGEKVAEYNTIAWNSNEKGYSVTEEAVVDNTNFTSAIALKITDEEIYHGRGGDAAMYFADTSKVNISAFAETPYAEMRFWIRVPHEVTFTLRLIHSLDGAYTKIIHKITVPASDKWQEIRIAREDFSGDAAFNNVLSNGGTVNIQILTDKNATDFMSQDEKLLMSPVSFYNGYIEGSIDPNGGTIVVTPKAGKEIGKYSTIGWNADNKGYTVTQAAVEDNSNFTSAAVLTITDEKAYSARGGDAAMYSAAVKDVNIKNWANKSYAQMRFWIKVPHEVTFTLRLIHSLDGVYTKVTHKITVPASSKWQEIRIAREDFSGDAAFNSAVASGGTVNIQILTDKNATDFLKQDEKLLLSPVSFFDGYISSALDPDGGTIVITPTKGKVIATYDTMGWNADGKGYTVTEAAVVDNKNFTSAVALQITDYNLYNSLGGDAAMYSAAVKDVNIKNWANKSYAQMRFWIKVPHEVTFTLRLIHSLDGVYTKITHKITVPASNKWQEIRIKRSDFSGDAAFNDAIAKGGTINIQILTDKNTTDFLKQDEKLLLSPVSFYNGYIEGNIDKTGGTIVITPKKGEMIAEYTVSGWNSTDKGYTVTDISVDDNKNFKIGRKLTVTDEKLYLSANRDPALFKGDNLTESIAEWAKMPYNEMRFWIKVPHEITFTVRLMNNSDGTYTGISTELTIPASDKWQEIRLKKEDFSGSKDFNSVVAKSGNVHFQILTDKNTTDFLKQDESLSISPIQFFNGYIAGDIDPTGGTVKVPDIYGNLINSIPAKVIKDIDGTKLQLVSVYDNDFVSKALKFTLTDEDLFYKEITQVNTNGADKPLDLSAWNEYSKAEIRFWIKVPRDMKFKLQIVEHNGTQYPYIETTVEIGYKEGWQQIVIPRSAFSSRTDFTGEYIQYIRFVPFDKSGDGYLEFCDSLYMSQVEFFDGIIPASADKVDKGKNGKIIKNIQLVPYVGNGSIPERVEVKDNSNFNSAVSTKIGEVRTFASGESAHVVHNDTETDLSAWHNNSNAQLRFWVRSAKDVVLQIGLQNPGSDKPSSYRAIWAQVSIKGSDSWQEIRLSAKHFSETENFDPSIVRYIKIKGIGDEAITTNEVFFISDIEVYDGVITKAVDSNGGTTKAYSDNAIIATFSDFSDYRIVSGKGITATQTAVDTSKYFTESLVLSGNGAYNVTLKTYYDTYDISRGTKGTLRLWVKTDSENTFNIVLTDKNGKTLKLPFSAKASDKWQELRGELSSVNTSGFDFKALFSVSIEGTLKSALQLGKSELWKKKLDTAIEADGGEVEPPLELPPTWDSLPTMPLDEENKLLVNTSNSDFWIGDWNDTSRERSIVAYNRGLDKKDINYYRFKIYKEISVVNADVYYKNPTPAMFYLRKVTDITPYIKTGTLRFWINVPKDMTITVTLQSIDENNKYSFATVEITLKKTDENNGFREVQIPLKDFYDAAVAASAQWNPYCVKNILIGGVEGCNESTFLSEGELLCVSHFEIWKAEALEPEPFDPTRIFYSMHGDIFVKDINDVLAKTAMLSAYRDTLNEEKYSSVAKRYFDSTELLMAYTIQLVSAGQYDYNVVTAYDEVSVYIPIPDGMDTDNLKIVIYNREGIHECEFTVENGYLVINTKQFGEFLLLKGGERNDTPFDYNFDMSEYFGLVSLKNAVTVPGKNSFNWLAVIIAAVVVIVCTLTAVVILILKKKGIAFRKGKV